MSHFFLDITDAQIALTSEAKIVSSPGAALYLNGHLQFGNAAFEELKRRPLDIRTDFWGQLTTVPLASGFADARHSADLVYEHLKFLFSEAGTVSDLSIIAPASLTQAQLELLLGILSALEQAPSSVIDRALLSCLGATEPTLHLDLQWRQLVISELETRDNQVSVTQSKTIPGLGYLDLLEQCLEHCADICVDQTRFDPRRSAESEQTLMNALPGVLATFKNKQETVITMGNYNFKVARSSLSNVGDRVMSAVETEGKLVSVDGLLASFPGVAYSGSTDAKGIVENARTLLEGRPSGEPLARISVAERAILDETTTSPVGEDKSSTEMDEPISDTPNTHPTHILIDAHAYAINSADSPARNFGVIFSDGVVCIEESYRSDISILSVASSYDELNNGCRLYRPDGKEALLIRVES